MNNIIMLASYVCFGLAIGSYARRFVDHAIFWTVFATYLLILRA